MFNITLAGTPNETDNAAGEFAITGTGNLNIVNTSGGRVIIDSDPASAPGRMRILPHSRFTQVDLDAG
jgi:hypothetical protein